MASSRFGDLRLYRRLADQARSSWPSILGLFLLSLLASPLAPAAVARSPAELLFLVAALAVLITLLSQLQSLARAYLTAAAGERLVLDFRARIFHHLQRLSLSYHDATGSADSTYRVQLDAPAIRSIVVEGF